MTPVFTKNAAIHRETAAALTHLGLISDPKKLPKPFKTLAGETEQSRTDYFYLEAREGRDSRLISVKRVGNSEKLSKLLAQITACRNKAEWSQFLPVANNNPDAPLLIYDDGCWVTKALRRMNLLTSKQPLPRPLEVFSGIAGLSRVYLFHLPDPSATGRGRVLLAKFDRPDRIRDEWRQIESVRGQTDACREIVTPLPSNMEEDGVILYPAFQAQSSRGMVLQLDQFLRQRLLSNDQQVETAMELLGKFLRKLYLGGGECHEGANWRKSNQELLDNLAKIKRLVADSGLIPGRNPAVWKIPLRSQSLELPNPFAKLDQRLDTPAGRLLKARTHGDLQSTNVLLALGAFGKPEDLAIIDLEKYRDHQLVVEDLARIEADFWRSVFTSIVVPAGRDRAGQKERETALTAFVLAMNSLDGRPPLVHDQNLQVSKLAHAAGRFIFRFRKLAWSLLRPRGEAPYDPTDYFHALLFYYLKALSRSLVYDDPLRFRIVLLAASLAEQTLRDLEKGLYPKQRSFVARWPARLSTAPKSPPPQAPRGKKKTKAVTIQRRPDKQSISRQAPHRKAPLVDQRGARISKNVNVAGSLTIHNF